LTGKNFDLTLRQSQVLTLAAQKIKHYGYVKVYDLLGDTGVGHTTLADHLSALQRDGYIKAPIDSEGKERLARNLSSYDTIVLTETGKKFAQEIMNFARASYKESPSCVNVEFVVMLSIPVPATTRMMPKNSNSGRNRFGFCHSIRMFILHIFWE
jgi:DNA-binding MarR family transcriptional regulator